MERSCRAEDMRAERALAAFMDDCFYSKVASRKGGSLTFQRMTDCASQQKGIDVSIKTDGQEMLIDEKASLYYSNLMIPTFAFELDWIQPGQRHRLPGWFLDERQDTKYYMLIWPNVKCTHKDNAWIRKDIRALSKNDFTIVEAMLLKKTDLQTALRQQGYDRKRLEDCAARFRKTCDADPEKTDRPSNEDLNGYLRLSYSGQLAEKPVNLVIRKEFLKKLAKGIYLISSDGYAALKD